MKIKGKSPSIVFKGHNYQKCMSLVRKCPQEVCMYGYGRYSEDGLTCYVEEIYVPKQKVTPTHTKPVDGDVQDYLNAKKLWPELELVCWIHSHVNMDVFFSGTDERTWAEFLVNVIDPNGLAKSTAAAVVFNKREQIYSRYRVKGFDFEDVSVIKTNPEDEWAEHFLKENVKLTYTGGIPHKNILDKSLKACKKAIESQKSIAKERNNSVQDYYLDK